MINPFRSPSACSTSLAICSGVNFPFSTLPISGFDRPAAHGFLEDRTVTPAEHIEGVLVRRPGQISGSWDSEDFAYVDQEVQAALLGWIWSLDCRVVNRYPASCTTVEWQLPTSWARGRNHAGTPTARIRKRLLGENNISPKQQGSNAGWRHWLANTKLTSGMNNVGDVRPPFADAFEGYDTEPPILLAAIFTSNWKKDSNLLPMP